MAGFVKSYITNFIPYHASIAKNISEEFKKVVNTGKQRLADYQKAEQAIQDKKNREEQAKRDKENVDKDTIVGPILKIIDNSNYLIIMPSFFSTINHRNELVLHYERGSSTEILQVGTLFVSKDGKIYLVKDTKNRIIDTTAEFEPRYYPFILERVTNRIKELNRAIKEQQDKDFVTKLLEQTKEK